MQDTPPPIIPTPAPTCCGKLMKVLTYLQCPVLLLLRLGFGYQFMLTGWGKLSNIEKPTQFFTELGIPMPRLNAYMAGTTEFVGGLFLILGLASRLVSIPLTFVMLVAYATAHRPSLVAIFSPTPDPKTQQIDALTERIRNAFDQAPFPFLCAALVILAFGPGRASLDHLICKFWKFGSHPEPELAKKL